MESPKLNELPLPAKIAGALAVIGAFVGLGAVVRDWQYMMVLAVGLVVVVLIVALFLFLRHRREMSRGNALAQKLPSGSPGSVRKADQLAQLDAMRRAFEEGVRKFRDAGRSLYSTPWYLLVGEPGGGKTEAIRHSEVRFFPGLHDYLQGTGGTINMNWWFTRDAIILDTAGRILFQEVQAGSGGEWDEFLNLLKGYRPNCPINGLLLMIPANTLLSDTSQEINQKASRIAQQFERVQMTLGVRFPVYVLVTKCDLIGGFNEFFEDLNDPRQQNQMLGWSNPAPLDTEFDPKLVDEHLQVVKNRLLRRRTRLLLDPPSTDGGPSKRLDQVDSLYSLPDNLMRIGPRLRQYLETIFVAGAWSQRPLFLRGIYFTCAMQKGSPLDPDLATALGIPVTDLPKEREWDRTRSYFLRDVFIEKAFAEKGLVTRVANVDSHRRRRKIAVLGGGFAAAAAFLVFTWFGYRDLQDNILRHSGFFTQMTSTSTRDGGYDPSLHVVVDPAGRYGGDRLVECKGLPGVSGLPKVTDLLLASRKLSEHDIKPWIIYKQFAPMTGELNNKRRSAHEALVVSAVLTPAIEATRYKLESGSAWSLDASNALIQLVRLERQLGEKRAANPAKDKQPASSTRPAAGIIDIDALYRYAMPAEEYAKFEVVKGDVLEKTVAWTYKSRESGGGGLNWPPESLVAKPDYLGIPIARGVEQFVKYCETQGTTNEKQYAAVMQLEDALKQYQQAEQKLFAIARDEPVTVDRHAQASQDWRTNADEVYARGKAVDASIAAVAEALNWDRSSPLAKAYKDKVEASQEGTLRAIQQLSAELEGETPALIAARAKLSEAIKAIQQRKAKAITAEHMAELSKLHDLFLQRPAEAQTKSLAALAGLFPSVAESSAAAHRYQVHLKLFACLEQCFAQTADPWKQGVTPDGKPRVEAPSVFTLAGRLKDSESRYQKLKESFADVLAKDAVKDEALAKLIDFARRSVAQQYETFAILDQVIKALPASQENWGGLVKAYAEANKLAVQRAAIPLTDPGSTLLDSSYAPEAVRKLAESWKALVAQTQDQAAPGAGVLPCIGRSSLRDSLSSRHEVLGQYATSYYRYWRDVAPATSLAFKRHDKWPTFRKELADLNIASVQAGLRSFGLILQQAFTTGDELEAALARGQRSDSAKANTSAAGLAEVKAALDEVERSKQQWTELVGKWQSLQEESVAARDELLPRKRFDFVNLYLLKSTGFIDAYWKQVPEVSLKLIAADVHRQAQEDIERLKKLQKFPLVRYLPGSGDELDNLGQLDTARELVRKISYSVDLDKDSLGGNPPVEFKEAVERMSGRNVFSNESERKWSQQVLKLLEALPQNKGDVLCKITVLSGKTTVRSPDLRIILGQTTEAVSVRTDSVFNKQFPIWSNDPIRFEIGLFDKAPGVVHASYPPKDRAPTKWAILRLMHEMKATPVVTLGRGAHAWEIELPVEENIQPGEKGKLVLLLQFDTRGAAKPDADLPQHGDWPDLQAQK